MATQQIRSEQILDGTIMNADINASAGIALTKFAEAVIQADGGQAFTGHQSLGGFNLTNLANPVAAQDAATKSYADSIAAGLDIKASVHAATTANITLSGTQTIDGIAVIVGNRVLVKNQTLGATNGLYVVAAGAWARSTDADVSSEVTSGLSTFVEEGTTQGATGWVLITPDPIVLGTTVLTFSQFSGGTLYSAGAGLSLTGSVFDVNVATAGSIEIVSDALQVKLNGASLTSAAAGLSVSAYTGDVTSSAGSTVNTLATVNSNVGTFGSATQVAQLTVNGKGLVTAVANVTIAPAASSITGGAALTKVDDTNVTLALGGSPTTALLAATSLTLGWTGTVAAARLNANVVQSVVNDTNVTGSIAAQTLTLGWTGTLSVARGGTGIATAFTPGSVVFAGASGVYSQDNANLFWDDATDRLTIGASLTIAANGFFAVNNAATVQLAGGTSGGSGNIILYGGAEATTPNELRFRQGTTVVWKMATSTAHFLPGTDNLHDIGSSSFRVRNLYLAGAVTTAFTAGSVLFVGPTGALAQNNGAFFWDNATGRLGIGITVPRSAIHVRGNVGAYVGAFGSSGLKASLYLGTVDFDSAGYYDKTPAVACYCEDATAKAGLALLTYDGTNQVQRVTVLAGGNVGIGTTIPATRLQVGAITDIASNLIRIATDGTAATAAPVLSLYRAGSSEGFIASVFSTSQKILIGGDPASYTTAALLAVAKVTIDTSSGNVGIGTNNPQNGIHLSMGNPYIRFDDTSGTTGTGYVGYNNSVLELWGSSGAATITVGATGMTLAGNLRFTTANTGIVPGATTFLITNAAASQNNLTLTDAGVLTISGFGTHLFSAGGSGANRLGVTNTTNASGNSAALDVTAGTQVTSVYAFAPSYGSSLDAWDVASGGALYSANAGGLSIVARNAAGAIRFFSGGSTERMSLLASGYVGIGTAVPDAPLVVSANATAPPTIATGTSLQVVQADAAINRVLMESFANVIFMQARRANGTNASKSALAAGDQIFQFAASGYTGSAYTGARAMIQFFTQEAWTSTANGTYMSFLTCPNGSATPAERLNIPHGGGLILPNVTTAPVVPASSGALYVESGVLKFKNSAGVVTTIAS